MDPGAGSSPFQIRSGKCQFTVLTTGGTDVISSRAERPDPTTTKSDDVF